MDAQAYTHLPPSIDGQEIPEVKQMNQDSRREVQTRFLESEASSDSEAVVTAANE
jgi:hypothetical protein